MENQGKQVRETVSSSAEATVFTPFANAYTKYFELVSERWQQVYLCFGTSDRTWQQEVQNANTPEDIKEANTRFLRAIDRCWTETGSGLQELYLNYLRDIQSAWTSTRIEEADPVILTSIGNLLHAAACVASSLGVHPQMVGAAKAAQNRLQAHK